jgi:hypothetical protein
MNDSVTDFSALRGYLATVATGLGVGLESCTIDIDAPVSAYLAVDHKAAAYPDRDVALLWDEVGGWSLAVETHSGEDLIVLADLGADEVAPPAERVVAFVDQHCPALPSETRFCLERGAVFRYMAEACVHSGRQPRARASAAHWLNPIGGVPGGPGHDGGTRVIMVR